MSNTAASAKIGKPPNNARDYNIIRGIYRQYGITTVDPSLGYVFAAKEPENAVHESKQPAIIAGMVIVMLAIIVPTAARLWVRGRGAHTKFGWDDWVLCIIVVVDAGGGTHTWENTYDDYQFYSYYLTVCRLLYYPTVGIIKISITLFIRRLVDTAYRTWKIVADVFLGTLVAYVLLAVFWSIFICNPPRAVWDREFGGSLAEPATCGNQFLSAKVLSIIHVVQSVLLLATPIIILWSVRIDRGKKIRLFIIWAAGGLTVTGGLLQQIQTFTSPDIFWEYTVILRWTVLDISMGIVTASLPVLDAAIMGSWRAAKSTLGISNRDRENSRGTKGTNPETISSGPRKAYASSAENIMGKDDGIEMDVIQQNGLDENADNHSIPDTTGHDGRHRVNNIV
ncbi:integral membrane protein [Colletotrichum tofieldiae]|nr:integral membrane protein [Colletotrichum tofieldiae]GKT76415.1 integral membrane protein [Colletotrichum tofieldiae]GKT87462.1 integral membrane protein [Colletotrichum tofieldiae]